MSDDKPQSILHWQFAMGTNVEPTWTVHQGFGADRSDWRLVAYAKRAKAGGWFVRIGNVNPRPEDEKMYIDENVFPPEFMISMLHMTHRKPWEEGDDNT